MLFQVCAEILGKSCTGNIRLALHAMKGGWTCCQRLAFLHDLMGDYSTYTFKYFWLLICCFLTFCSLGSNQISAEGAHAVAAALQVNQSLQKLEWVQPFMSLYILLSFITSLKVYTVSIVPRYVLKFLEGLQMTLGNIPLVALFCGMPKIIVHSALIRTNNDLWIALGQNWDELPSHWQKLQRLKLMVTHSL